MGKRRLEGGQLTDRKEWQIEFESRSDINIPIYTHIRNVQGIA